MKYFLLALLMCLLFSCSTYKLYFTSTDDRKQLHQTNRPDTCRLGRLTTISFKGKKPITDSLKLVATE